MTDAVPLSRGTLYVVATPIGNVADLSPRAVDVLAAVDRILCEDTRRTGTLLKTLGVRGRLESHHDHNEAARVDVVVRALRAGETLALVSDAGAPLVSDPGYRLVRGAIDAGVPVVPVPGPSAVITALMAAGLPTDRFLFLGYLPARKGRARTALEEVAEVRATLVLFEAPHRIRATVALAHEVLGDRAAAVGREMTKRFEEFVRGPLSVIGTHLDDHPPRGEFTLVVDGRRVEPVDPTPSFRGQAAEMYDRLLREGCDPDEAERRTKDVFG